MSKLSLDLPTVTTVAVELAKHVFQVHGCDAQGKVVVAKALRRRDVVPFFASLGPCLIGMEACGSAHHWGRVKITVTGAITPKFQSVHCPIMPVEMLL
jgi:transposase